MMAHPHDDIEAFALGGLDEVTAKRVLAHADQCPTCAVLLAEAISVVNVLEPTDERPLSAPVQLRNIHSTGAASLNPWSKLPVWASTFVAAAAVLALLVWNLNLRSSHVTVPIATLVHSHFQHHALHGAAGSAKVIQGIDGSWLYLLADGLSPKTRYELSETAGGTQRQVGEFMTDASGRATAYWEQTPTGIQALAVAAVDAKSASNQELRWP